MINIYVALMQRHTIIWWLEETIEDLKLFVLYEVVINCVTYRMSLWSAVKSCQVTTCIPRVLRQPELKSQCNSMLRLHHHLVDKYQTTTMKVVAALGKSWVEWDWSQLVKPNIHCCNITRPRGVSQSRCYDEALSLQGILLHKKVFVNMNKTNFQDSEYLRHEIHSSPLVQE